MKDVDLKKENEDLRKELAEYKLKLRQVNASNKAFQHSYNMSLNELQALKVELALVSEDLQEKSAEVPKPGLESVA